MHIAKHKLCLYIIMNRVILSYDDSVLLIKKYRIESNCRLSIKFNDVCLPIIIYNTALYSCKSCSRCSDLFRLVKTSVYYIASKTFLG